MTFWQSVAATFIGALFGFLFSIALFYITTIIFRKRQRRILEKNVIKEFEFNEDYLKRLQQELGKVIEKISLDDKTIFNYLKYTSYASLFIKAYFGEGLLFEKLEPEDILALDAIISYMEKPAEDFIGDAIHEWNEGSFDKGMISKLITLERDRIEQYIKDIRKIRKKLGDK